jgi:hypothetical protein
MGEVVGAALIAHVPTIVLPEKIRRELNHGEDSTLPAALEQLRKEVFETLDYDTVVVDHWRRSVEFVVTAQEDTGSSPPKIAPGNPSGRTISGRPELAHLIAANAKRTAPGSPRSKTISVDFAPPTCGISARPAGQAVSIGFARPRTPKTTCGSAGDAIAESDRKCADASGAFPSLWSLRKLAS